MKITSIPTLIEQHGSMAATARNTGLSEMTVAKYRFDRNMERHAIINGRLMVAHSHSRQIEGDV